MLVYKGVKNVKWSDDDSGTSRRLASRRHLPMATLFLLRSFFFGQRLTTTARNSARATTPLHLPPLFPRFPLIPTHPQSSRVSRLGVAFAISQTQRQTCRRQGGRRGRATATRASRSPLPRSARGRRGSGGRARATRGLPGKAGAGGRVEESKTRERTRMGWKAGVMLVAVALTPSNSDTLPTFPPAHIFPLNSLGTVKHYTLSPRTLNPQARTPAPLHPQIRTHLNL